MAQKDLLELIALEKEYRSLLAAVDQEIMEELPSELGDLERYLFGFEEDLES